MKISERIKEIRLKNNLTQQQFANELDVGVALVAHWETERNNPKLENLTTICEKFKITADWLLFGKEAPENLLYAREPESEYQTAVKLKSLTESVTGIKQGDATPQEAESLKAEVKRLREELWLSSQKWDKRIQQMEKLVQSGFDALSEALVDHSASEQKGDDKAKGAPSHKK